MENYSKNDVLKSMVIIENLQKIGITGKSTAFKAGQTVRVFQKIQEGEKERIQIFEGIILEVKNLKKVNATITVRKIFDGIGVEKVIPIHSPLIEKIELLKEAKVRRKRIFFMRFLRGKAARLRERFFTREELDEHSGINKKKHEKKDKKEESLVTKEKDAKQSYSKKVEGSENNVSGDDNIEKKTPSSRNKS